MIQTWAIIVDAYRELNSRKLFWISMGLSLLVVAVLKQVSLDSPPPDVKKNRRIDG